MSPLTVVTLAAVLMAGIGLLAILTWLVYATYLTRRERRLAKRKGLYRDLVSGLATRERALLEPTLRQFETLYDFEALEAVLEEQARTATDRPAWLLDTYDRLGLVDKYIDRLRHARQWRERAFSAELLGRVGNARAVPALLETVRATRTEDADVREIALRAIARIADPRAVEPLIEALRHAEVWLAPRIADVLVRHGEAVAEPMMRFLDEPVRHPARAWAANILGELRIARAFPILVRALDDLDDEVRAKAATALGRLGNRQAGTHLLEHLLSDPAPFVRARIANALGQFDDDEVIDRLVRALGDPAWWVRMRSVEAFEQIGPAAEGALLVALEDPDAEIRARAAAALERMGFPQRLVEQLEAGGREAEAIDTLARFAAAGARELLAELLLHPTVAVRRAALIAIGRGERRELGRELLQVAAGDEATELRALAFDVLREHGIREAIPVARDALAHPAPRLRAAAIGALGTLAGREAAGDIRRCVADPEAEVRAAAIRALGPAGGGAAPELLAATFEDADDRVRASAVDTAAEQGDAASEPAVRARLAHDASPFVRERAALALGILGTPAGEAALRAVDRSDQPPGVIAAVVLALGAYDHESVVARVAALPDEATVRDVLHDRLRHDSAFRRLAGRLPAARAAELEALGAGSPDAAGASLADGMHGTLDVPERLRLVGGLRAMPGERGRSALTGVVRGDPSPEVRAAALAALADTVEGDELLHAARRALADPSPAVRHAAVTLFLRFPPEQALETLVHTVHADAEPAVVQAVARQAEAAFDTFGDLVLGLDPDGPAGAVVARLAREIRHPGLGRLLTPFLRSRAPAVRTAVARLLSERPDLVHARHLDALLTDPVVAVRQYGVRAAAASGRFDRLLELAADPDVTVRRTVALLVHGEPSTPVPEQLTRDADEEVRAAAFVARLLRGEITEQPVDISRAAAAHAVTDAARLEDLRSTARGAPDSHHRLSAALALAVVNDPAAHEVAATDPVAAVRRRVAAALDRTVAEPVG